LEAQRLKKEHEKKAAEQAEEDRKLRQERLEEEERIAYLEWKTFFGTLTVKEWIAELEETRKVSLEGLAERFSVSKREILERIQALIETQRVAGTLEEDTFTYFSPQDLKALAAFVMNRDFTSWSELSVEADRLVSG